MVASVPVILLFAAVLAALLTAIFVFEAFVTHLYTGPGHKYIVSLPQSASAITQANNTHQSFSPTILFIAHLSRRVSLLFIKPLPCDLRNGRTMHINPTHNASLTNYQDFLPLRYCRLPRSCAVSIRLRAFRRILDEASVQKVFADRTEFGLLREKYAEVKSDIKSAGAGVWMTDVSIARKKLNPSRLQDQMFAYTVTNQVINTFLEIGLPYVLRFVDSIRNGSNRKGLRTHLAPLRELGQWKEETCCIRGPGGSAESGEEWHRK